MNPKIEMYTSTFCGYCSAAKTLLKSKGVEWEEINLDTQPDRRDEMLKRSEGRRSVPQIFINGKGVGGFDDIAELEADDELGPLLGLSPHKEETNMEHHRIIVLGSGPAGLTAAIYAARANLKPVVVSGNEPGGQLTTTTEVENFPGYPDGVQGPEMMEDLKKQAERFETVFKMGNVGSVDLSKRPFSLHLESGETLTTDALIISTGASAKWIGLESEQRLKNRGVSACATCDGFFFKGKPLAVVGGGDTALEEALYLTNFATEVNLIHRRDEFRGSMVMQARAKANEKINIIWNAVVDEVLGDEKKGVTGLRLKDTQNGNMSELAVDGMFVAIGHQPNTDIFKDQLEMDELGYLVVNPGTTYTSVPGVFASGDVADKTYRQAITAAGTGCMAAIDAERWLAEQEHANPEESKNRATA